MFDAQSQAPGEKPPPGLGQLRHAERVLALALHEVMRQVWTHSPVRGALVLRLYRFHFALFQRLLLLAQRWLRIDFAQLQRECAATRRALDAELAETGTREAAATMARLKTVKARVAVLEADISKFTRRIRKMKREKNVHRAREKEVRGDVFFFFSGLSTSY
jgi:hypothetical protein